MSLSDSLIKDFIKATAPPKQAKSETTLYGTVTVNSTATYVKIDGSDILTPATTTSAVKSGDRVTVIIKNHTAVITGNVTNPSASSGDVDEISGKIGEYDTILAEVVTTDELNAQVARIDELYADNVVIKGDLTASKADIDELKAKNVTIEGDLTAAKAEIETLKATTITTEFLEANYAKITDLEATNATIHNLTADFGEFKEITTTDISAINARIDNITASTITTEYLDANYAKIDLANIKAGCITTAMIGEGVIESANIADGSITDAKIVGLTANKITAGTLDATEIEVINLNCANLTVGTINGQQISSGAINWDKLAGDVSGEITQAGEDAQKAIQDALNAMNKAEGAQTTANGKNTIYYQSTKPTGGTYKVNDIWYDIQNGYAMYYWNGSTWVNAVFGSDAFADGIISADKISSDVNAKLNEAFNDANKAITDAASAISEANTAKSKADKATSDASTALTNASNAQNTANKAAQDLANMSIGGRNLFYNSNFAEALDTNKYFARGYAYVLSIVDGGYNGNKCLKAAAKKAGISGVNDINIRFSTNITLKTEYTFSGYIKADAATTLFSRFGYDTVTKTVSVGTEWKYFSVNITNQASQVTDTFIIYISTVTNVYFSQIKLEKGTKATDWTPAPEDILDPLYEWSYDESLNTIDGGKIAAKTVTAAQIAAKTITADQIAANTITAASGIIANAAIGTAQIADASVTNAKIANLDAGKITTGYLSADRIQAGSIVIGKLDSGTQTTISNASTNATNALTKATQAITDLNNLEVGGRNILNNSDFSRELSGWVVESTTMTYKVLDDSQVGKYLSLKSTAAGNLNGNRLYQVNFANGDGSHIANQVYSLSFYARATTSTAVGIHAGWVSGIKAFSISGTTWKRYTVTYTPTGTGSLTFYIDNANTEVHIAQVKLEKGNKPTDWTPAPEDTDASIAQVDAYIAAWCYNNDKTYINGGKIYTGTVTATQIAANAIIAGKIAANAVTTANLQADSVNSDKIAANAILAEHIKAGVITGDKLVASTITGAKIAAKTITATNIAANTITSAEINASSIKAVILTADSITGNMIAANALKSRNYVAGSTGSFLNLADGSFDSKNFKFSSTGAVTATDVNLTGKVNATSGKIGKWEILADGMLQCLTSTASGDSIGALIIGDESIGTGDVKASNYISINNSSIFMSSPDGGSIELRNAGRATGGSSGYYRLHMGGSKTSYFNVTLGEFPGGSAGVDTGVPISTASTITANGSIRGNAFYTGNWFRSEGATGWYSQTYGGGWYMSDSTWIRAYNGKSIYTPGTMQAGVIIALNDLTARGSLYTKNDASIICKKSNGTWSHLIGISSGDNVYVGDSGNLSPAKNTNIYGGERINFYSHRASASYKGATVTIYREQSGAHRTLLSTTVDNTVCLGSTSYRWTHIYVRNAGYAAGGWVTSSDLKIKHNIKPIDKAYSFIMGLKPFSYTKYDGKRIHLGFGAQQVAELSKNIGMGDLSLYDARLIDSEGIDHDYHGEDIDDKYLEWNLNYDEFIAPLVCVAQTHDEEIAKLKAEIIQLRSKLNAYVNGEIEIKQLEEVK